MSVTPKYTSSVIRIFYLHSGQKCFVWVSCLWSKMPMFQRAGMREGGLPLPLAFQYVILVIWRACDLNLAIISPLVSKWQVLNVVMPIFQPLYIMKLKASTSWPFEPFYFINRPPTPNILGGSVCKYSFSNFLS